MAGYRHARIHTVLETGDEIEFHGPAGAKLPTQENKLTVSEVAKMTGVSPTTLRHYDNIGLLRPKRTGMGISNNRKLYGPDDLNRLGAIVTFSGYKFSLEEIARILDGKPTDIYEIMGDKLVELEKQISQLKALVLFANFVGIADEDLVEGLGNGPSELNELANISREYEFYEETMQKLDDMGEQEAAAILSELDDMLEVFVLAASIQGFEGVEAIAETFIPWWNEHIISFDEVGYFGFWAIFEDHSLVAEHVETIGEVGDAGFLEMYLFFYMMRNFIIKTEPLIRIVAGLTNADIVAAIDTCYDIIVECVFYAFGHSLWDVDSIDIFADLTNYMLSFIESILSNTTLCDYLELSCVVTYEVEDLHLVQRVLSLMSSETEEDEEENEITPEEVFERTFKAESANETEPRKSLREIT